MCRLKNCAYGCDFVLRSVLTFFLNYFLEVFWVCLVIVDCFCLCLFIVCWGVSGVYVSLLCWCVVE